MRPKAGIWDSHRDCVTERGGGVEHCLGKCLVGRRLGKRLWSCYFKAPQTVFISCLVYRRPASGLTSHKSNYRHCGSNFSPLPLLTIVLGCRAVRKSALALISNRRVCLFFLWVSGRLLLSVEIRDYWKWSWRCAGNKALTLFDISIA